MEARRCLQGVEILKNEGLAFVSLDGQPSLPLVVQNPEKETSWIYGRTSLPSAGRNPQKMKALEILKK